MAEPNPFEFIAGTTVKWSKTLPDYPASEWTLDYWIRSAFETLHITATPNGLDFAVVITAAQSAKLPPGEYAWQALVTKGDERYPAGKGLLRVFPLFETAGNFDPRTENQKRLDAIDAVLAGKATADVFEYTINGRQLRRYTSSDLLKLRDHFARLVAVEKAAARSASGGDVFRSVNFVFGGDS